MTFLLSLLGGVLGGALLQWFRAPKTTGSAEETDPVVLAWARWAVLTATQKGADPTGELLAQHARYYSTAPEAKVFARAMKAIPQAKRALELEREVAKLDQKMANLTEG